MTTRPTGHNQTKLSLSITLASVAMMSSQIRELITDIPACAGARTHRTPAGGWNQINYLHIPRSTTLHPSQRVESQPLSAYNQNTTKRRINASDWGSQQTLASEWRERRAAGKRLWRYLRAHSVQLFGSAEDLGNKNSNILLRSESEQKNKPAAAEGQLRYRSSSSSGYIQLCCRCCWINLHQMGKEK